MSDRIDRWVDRLSLFDLYTEYSDDHRVYTDGINARARLKRDIAEAGFTQNEKEEILNLVGDRWTQSYLLSRERYSYMVEHPLWNEGDGPDRKKFVKTYLDL